MSHTCKGKTREKPSPIPEAPLHLICVLFAPGIKHHIVHIPYPVRRFSITTSQVANICPSFWCGESTLQLSVNLLASFLIGE